jgi:hypothetical protein
MKRIFSRFPGFWGRKASRFACAFFTAVVAVLLTPHAAEAQTYVGTLICNVANEINGNTPLIDLFDAIAFISGTYLFGRALYDLKEHVDDPSPRHPLYKPLAKMVAAAALLELPFFIGWLIGTLFGQQVNGGVLACNPVAPVAVAADPSVMVTNFMNSIQGPLTYLISILCFTIGTFLIVRGLLKAAKIGTDRNTTTNILANLIIGTVLVSVGECSNVLLATVFGNATIANAATPGAQIVGAWPMVTQLNASQSFINAIAAALDFFQLIGMIAFVRGFMIIRNAVEGNGQATMAQGFTHVIGGILAINIYQVLEIFDATLGTGWL